MHTHRWAQKPKGLLWALLFHPNIQFVFEILSITSGNILATVNFPPVPVLDFLTMAKCHEILSHVDMTRNKNVLNLDYEYDTFHTPHITPTWLHELKR